MSIRIDPVNQPPFHALNKRDITDLLSSVPESWQFYMRYTTLVATKPENSRFSRRVISDEFGRNFRVHCRGIAPEVAFRDILVDLAARVHPTIAFLPYHKLTKAHVHRLEQHVAPLVAKLVQRKKERDDEKQLESEM